MFSTKHILIGIAILIVISSLAGNYYLYDSLVKTEAVSKQNMAALGDSLKIISNEKTKAYHKLSQVLDLSNKMHSEKEDLINLIEERDEKVEELTEIVARFEHTGQSVSVVEEDDTNNIPDRLIGKRIHFPYKNNFYSLDIDVALGNPSTETHTLITKEFSLDIVGTETEKGIKAKTIKIFPEGFDEILFIKDVTITVDDKKYKEEISSEDYGIFLTPKLGILILPELYLNAGAEVEINNHSIEAMIGIGKKYYEITYGRRFRMF